MYTGEMKTMMDECDSESDMFQTFNDVATAKLTALVDTSVETRGAGTRSVLTPMQIVRNKYGTIFDDDGGFVPDAGDPRFMRLFASIRSDRLAQPSSSASPRTDQGTFDRIPESESPATADLERKMADLACVALELDFGFWKSENNFVRMRNESAGWLWADADECTLSFDINTPACYRHDFAYESLQRFVPSTDDSNDLDEAWNPRNKYLADLEFLEDLEEHGCEFDLNRGWWLFNDFISFENSSVHPTEFSYPRALVCLVLNRLQAEGLVALIYHWSVNKFNHKGWVITKQEVAHAENNREFVPCIPPVPKDMVYSHTQDGSFNISVEWDNEESCVDGVEIARHEYKWKVVTGLGDDEFHSENDDGVSGNTRSDEWSVPATHRPSMRSVQLSEVRVVPRDIEHGNLFGGGAYPVPDSLIGKYDTTLFISNVYIDSDDELEVGESASLMVEYQKSPAAGAGVYTREWQVKTGSTWTKLPDGVTGTHHASPSYTTEGKRTFRFVCTFSPANSGQPGLGPKSYEATSDELEVEWTVETSGTITADPDEITVGEHTDIDASYTVPTSSTGAAITYTTHLSTRSNCPGRSDDDVSSAKNSGTLSQSLWGCSAGEATVKLIELPSRVVIGTVTVDVEAAPELTSVPTGTLTVGDTSVEVGDSISVRATYDVHGTGFGRITFDEELDNNSGCTSPGTRDDEPRLSGTIRDTLYACSAGTGYIYLTDSHENSVIQRVSVTVSLPATPVATGSISADDTEIEVGDRVSVVETYNVPGGRAYISYTAGALSSSSSCPRSEEEGEQNAELVSTGVGATSTTLYGCRRGTSTVYLRASTTGNPELDSVRVTVSTPNPPNVSNLRWTIGQTTIHYSWTLPSGYTRSQVTFDGDASNITGSSYTARSLIPGASYRFSVRTLSADGTETSGRTSVTLMTDCATGDICRSTRESLSSFGDGIYRVGSEVQPGTYVIGTEDEGEVCEWGRLANLDGSNGQEIEVGGYEAGKTVGIEDTDHAFFTFNCGAWERQEE